MKSCAILFLFLFPFFTVFSQTTEDSRTLPDPYIQLKDGSIYLVKKPLVILDSILYIRLAETSEVLTFPVKDVELISNNCSYHRLTEGQKNRLLISNVSNVILTAVSLTSSVVFTSIGIVQIQLASVFAVVKYFYTPIFLIVGIGSLVPAALLIRSMVIKKRMINLFNDAKGIRLTQHSGTVDPTQGFGSGMGNETMFPLDKV